MRKERRFVDTLDHATRFGQLGLASLAYLLFVLAFVDVRLAVFAGERTQSFCDACRGDTRHRPRPPDWLQLSQRLLRSPETLGDDDDGILDFEDAAHAAMLHRRRFVERLEHAAEHRRLRDGCVQHPGLAHVDPVNRAAVDLRMQIEPVHRLAYELPFAPRLQRHVFGLRQPLRIASECRVRSAARRLLVAHDAAARDAFLDADSPALRGSLQQHGAGSRAGLAQSIEHAAHRTAAARLVRLPHAIVLDIDRCEVDSHLRPVELQFLGENLGQPRLRALPHLGGVRQQTESAVGVDADPACDYVADSAVGGAKRHADIDE